MVNKIIASKSQYSLLSGKHKFLCYNTIIILLIFLLGFTLIGFLAYNFLKTAIAEEKLLNNVKKPSWLHWIWNQNFSNNNNFQSSIKPIDDQYIVCYYAMSNSKHDYFDPSNIDPNLCTHIIIGFASITNCTIDLGENLTVYYEILKLKKLTPDLKVMISVGGGNAVNENYDDGFGEMVSNHTNRKNFIKSVLNAVSIFNFDGLDLDWEFPGWAGDGKINPEKQKVNFIQLLEELKREFKQYKNKTLILSAAVASPQSIIDQSYLVPELAENIDFVNLMSYDYHFFLWYYPVTDLNSPLFPRSSEIGYLTTLNVNFSANYWIYKGMPREKIVIGIPLYGHSYKLYNSYNHGLKAPAKSAGNLGLLGFVTYWQVCEFLKSGATKVFVNESRVPYAYKNLEWVSYDDVTSVAYKANWIKNNGFKGAMVYSLNSDDWKYSCMSSKKFPLTNTLKNVLKKQ